MKYNLYRMDSKTLKAFLSKEVAIVKSKPTQRLTKSPKKLASNV